MAVLPHMEIAREDVTDLCVRVEVQGSCDKLLER